MRLPSHASKANPAWVPALWLGRDTSSNQRIVGTSDGVFKIRSLRRVAVEEQVSPDMFKGCKGTPWDPRGREAEETGDFTQLGLPLPAFKATSTSATQVSLQGASAGEAATSDVAMPATAPKRTSEQAQLSDKAEPAKLVPACRTYILLVTASVWSRRVQRSATPNFTRCPQLSLMTSAPALSLCLSLWRV